MSLLSKIASYLGGRVVNFAEKRSQRYFDEKNRKTYLLECFVKGVSAYILQKTDSDALMMIRSYAASPFVIENIEASYYIDKKERAVQALVHSFRQYSKGSFVADFNYRDCIISGLENVWKAQDSNAQNINAINRKVDALLAKQSCYEYSESTEMMEVYQFSPSSLTALLADKYVDYDDTLKKIESAFKKDRHIVISGNVGCGKKCAAARYASKYAPCIWIEASQIYSLEDLFSAINRKADIVPIGTSLDVLRKYFYHNPGWLIVFADLPIDLAKEVEEYIASLSCATLITTVATTLTAHVTISLPLPTEAEAILIYKEYIPTVDANDQSLPELVRFAVYRPAIIRIIANLQSLLHIDCNKLWDEIDCMKVHADSGAQNSEMINGILSRIAPILHLDPAESKLLSIMEQLPPHVVSMNMLYYLIQYTQTPLEALDGLLKKGLVIRVVDNGKVLYIRSQLASHFALPDAMDERFMQGILEYLTCVWSMDRHVCRYEILEACEYAELLYNNMYANEPSAVWTYFLLVRAKLLIALHRYHESIQVCHDILEVPGIKELPEWYMSVRIHLARAYASYEMPEEANQMLSEIPVNELSEGAQEEVGDIRRMIAMLNKDYDSLIKEELVNMSSDDFERVQQYQFLATLYYKSDDIEQALNYNSDAIALLKKLDIMDTGLASMVYTAYSAALCDSGKIDKAIEWGEKGRAIACRVFGNENSHTITSRNNVANAYYRAGRYTEAMKEYMCILDVYPAVFSPLSAIIVHAKGVLTLCRIHLGYTFDGKEFKMLMLEVAEKPERYGYITNLFIGAGINAVENYDIPLLAKLTGIIKAWIRGYVIYPTREVDMILLTRLEMIKEIGKSMYRVAPDDKQKHSSRRKNFAIISRSVLNGMFDNEEDPIDYSEKLPSEKYIPVYSSQILVPSMRERGAPVFYASKEFGIPDVADFGVRITDESMSPLFDPYDILWIHEQENIPTGSLAVCIDEGLRWYCGQIHTIAGCRLLRPLNRAFAAVPIEQKHGYVIKGVVINMKEGRHK